MLCTRTFILLAILWLYVEGKTSDEFTTDVSKNKTEQLEEENTEFPKAASCKCVPYYMCNEPDRTNGDGIIDTRFMSGESTVAQCETYIEVCCNEPITPTPRPMTGVGCGRRNADGVGFQLTENSDHEARFGEFPWMIAVLRQERNDGNPRGLNVFQCGGALIHPRVVVTAAHCVSGGKQLKIRAGEWDTQTVKEPYPHQDREVETVVVHGQYNNKTHHNDIALLFLKTPVDLAENVDVVCLPPQGTNVDGTRCFVSGWGKDVFDKTDRYQVILKKIDLPVVPRAECQETLRKTRLGEHFELHESFICAGGEPGKDTCKGDGGSPLVCPIPGQNGRYQQMGVVAWSIGCGGNAPVAYVNLGMFRNWIDQQMEVKKIDASSYRY